jgi:hypothetical protein
MVTLIPPPVDVAVATGVTIAVGDVVAVAVGTVVTMAVGGACVGNGVALESRAVTRYVGKLVIL